MLANSFKVELKFCECCGGLWLRQEKATEVYCARCAPQMHDIARGKKKRPCSQPAVLQSGGVVCA